MREKRYTKEFRDSTVQLVLNSGEKPTKVAEDLDLNVKTLYHWINVYKREHNIITESSSNNSTIKETMEEELKRLRRENKLLKQERDILKKATAYFAKETL